MPDDALRAIDHFMIGYRDLDALAAWFLDQTGVAAAAGGSHPDWGTHNRLIGTATSTYLELIAPDPAQNRQSGLRQSLQALARPCLHRIIVSGDAGRFPALIDAYAAEGITAEIVAMSRALPNGDMLRWQLLVPDASNFLGLFAPLFIDWQGARHPSKTLPQTPCQVDALEARHPDAQSIGRLWRSLGLELPVQHADRPWMALQLATPRGLVTVESAR